MALGPIDPIRNPVGWINASTQQRRSDAEAYAAAQGRPPAGPRPELDPKTLAALEEAALNDQSRLAEVLAEHMSLPMRAILEHADPCERLLLAAHYWAVPGAGALGLKPWHTGGYDPLANFSSVHMKKPKSPPQEATPNRAPLALTHARLWAHALPEYWPSAADVQLHGDVAWPSRTVAAWFAKEARRKKIRPDRYWDRWHQKVFVFDSTTIEPGRDIGVSPVALPVAVTKEGSLLPPDRHLSLSGLAAMARVLGLADDRLRLHGDNSLGPVDGSLAQLAIELWRASGSSAKPRRIPVGWYDSLFGRKTVYFTAETAIPLRECMWDISSGHGHGWGDAGKVSKEMHMTGVTQAGSFVPMDAITKPEWKAHMYAYAVRPGNPHPRSIVHDGIYAESIQPSSLMSLRDDLTRKLGATTAPTPD
jgi:hypothetical protein